MFGNFKIFDNFALAFKTKSELVGSKNKKLQKEIELWLSWDKNETTLSEIKRLVEKNAFDELKEVLMGRVTFFAEGILAEEGAGFRKINDLVAIEIAQGICDYLLYMNAVPEGRCVVVGYDGRHNSRRFAELAATIFIQKKFTVLLFSKPTITCLVSYSVIRYAADFGIMFTAGHYPKNYNGCKVFSSNGASADGIVSKAILKHMELCMAPWLGSWDVSFVKNGPYCVDPYDDIILRYRLDCAAHCFHHTANMVSGERFTFSTMHGIALVFIKELMAEFGFSSECLIFVKEQIEINPDFPTLEWPDPQNGEEALSLAINTANKCGSNLIFGVAPDGGRFVFAERRQGKEWYVYNGNEIGILLTWWTWNNWHKRNQNVSADNVFVLSTVVSSQFPKTMARKEGFKHFETLPGLNFLANSAYDVQKNKKIPLLAWDQSMSYMPGVSLYKDATLVSAMLSDCSSYLYRQGMTFHDQLESIFATYGYHYTFSSYVLSPDNYVIENIFKDLQKHKTIIGTYKVKLVRDMLPWLESSMPDKKSLLSSYPKYHMITYTLEDHAVITICGCQTRSMISYFLEVTTKPYQIKDLHSTHQLMNALKKLVVTELLPADKYNLKLS